MSCLYSIGGIDFNTNVPDANGNVWLCKDLTGWDSPEVRATLQGRVGEHGEIPSDLQYRARKMVLTGGYVECASDDARDDARYQLASVLNLVDNISDLVVHENTLVAGVSTPTPKHCAVIRDPGNPLRMRNDGTTVSMNRGLCYPFAFEAPLMAPDPRKYGTTLVQVGLSGGFTVTNAGNFPARPTFNLQGATDPVVLTNLTTGVSFRLHTQPTVTLPFPGGVAVNMADKTVIDGVGANRYDLRDLQSQWWTLLPGVNSLAVSGATGGTVTFYPTWI